MLHFDSPRAVRDAFPEGPLWLTLGTFDGVHRGHAHLIGELRERAAGAPTVVLTFARHPKQVLAGRPPRPLTPLPLKLRRLEALGVDAVLVVDFDDALAATEPDAFVRDWIVRDLRATGVVLGYNNRFGRGGRGDFALLARLGAEIGFDVVEGTPLRVDGAPVSSTRIRAALDAGDCAIATALLGRAHAVLGPVIPGAGRGRTIGIPTANVRVGTAHLPRQGVYGGHACAAHLPEPVPALINLGVRPTFAEGDADAGAPVLEAHLLDYSGNLTGAELEVSFATHLRDERTFDGPGALVAQIWRDRTAYEQWLAAVDR